VVIFIETALAVVLLVALAAYPKWRHSVRVFPSGEISFIAFVLLALFLIGRL
jgi:hypothetical protein